MISTTRHTHINQMISLFEQEVQPFRKVHRMIDLFETIIKTHTAIIIADYFRQRQLSDDIKGILAEGLRTPSLGIWQFISRTIVNEMAAGKDMLPFIEGFYTYFNKWDKNLRAGEKDVIAFRNQYAHGATPSDRQCEMDISRMIPVLRQMLVVPWLSASTIVVFNEIDGHWTPAHQDGWKDDLLLTGRPLDFPGVLLPGRPYLVIEVDGSIRLLDLFPILYFKEGMKDGIGYRSLAFLNDLKKWDKKEISFLNYPHSHLFREGANVFEQFQQVIKVDEWKRWLSRDFRERIQRLTENFQGRELELAALREFINNKDKRFAIVQGDAGIGKSALLARLLEELQLESDQQSLIVIEYFIRRGSQFAFSSKLVMYFIERLLQVFSLPLKMETSVDDNYILLQELVIKIAKDKLAGKQLVFIIDGVDEGIGDDQKIIDYLWTEVPGAIKVIYSGRRGDADPFFARVRAANENNVQQINLEALQEAVVRAILYGTDKYKLLSEQGGNYIHQVALRSGGNPNYLKWLLNSIESGDLELNAADRLPENVEAFFEPFLKKFSSVPGCESALVLKCLYTIAAAKDMLSPHHVQLIHQMDHGEVERVFGRLSEVLIESERIMEHNNGSTEVVKFYQVYHEDFLMFLKRYRADQLRMEEEEIVRFSLQITNTASHQAVNRYIQRYTFEFLPLHLYHLYQITGGNQFKEQLVALCFDKGFKEKQIVNTDQYERTFELLYFGLSVLDEQTEFRERISIGIEAIQLRQQFYNQVEQIKKWISVGERDEVLLVLRRISLFESEEHRLLLYYYLLSRLTYEQGEKAQPLLQLVMKTLDNDLPEGNKVQDWTHWLPPVAVFEMLQRLHDMEIDVVPILSRGDRYPLSEDRSNKEVDEDSMPPRVWAWDQTRMTIGILLNKPSVQLLDFIAREWDSVKYQYCSHIAKTDPDKAAIILPLINDTDYKVKAMLALGKGYYERKLVTKANLILEDAAILIQQMNEPRGGSYYDNQQVAYKDLTCLYKDYQQLDRALAVVDKVDEYWWADEYYELAVAFDVKGENARAFGLFQRIVEKLSHQDKESRNEEVLAMAYVHTDKLQIALALVDEESTAYAKSKIRKRIVKALLKRGATADAIAVATAPEKGRSDEEIVDIIVDATEKEDISTAVRLLPKLQRTLNEWSTGEVIRGLYGKVPIDVLLQWVKNRKNKELEMYLICLMYAITRENTSDISSKPFDLFINLPNPPKPYYDWFDEVLTLIERLIEKELLEIASRLIAKCRSAISPETNMIGLLFARMSVAYWGIEDHTEALICAQHGLSHYRVLANYDDRSAAFKWIATVYVRLGKTRDIIHAVESIEDEWARIHTLVDLSMIVATFEPGNQFETLLCQASKLAHKIDSRDSFSRVMRVINSYWFRLGNRAMLEDALLSIIVMPVVQERFKQFSIDKMPAYYLTAGQNKKAYRLLAVLESKELEVGIEDIVEYTIEQGNPRGDTDLISRIDSVDRMDMVIEKVIQKCLEQHFYDQTAEFISIEGKLIEALKQKKIHYLISFQPMLALLLQQHLVKEAWELVNSTQGKRLYDEGLAIIANYYATTGNTVAAENTTAKVQGASARYKLFMELHTYYVKQGYLVKGQEMLWQAFKNIGNDDWEDEILSLYLNVQRAAGEQGLHNIWKACHPELIKYAKYADRRDYGDAEIEHSQDSHFQSVIDLYLQLGETELAVALTEEIVFDYHKAYALCMIAIYWANRQQIAACHHLLNLALEVIQDISSEFYYRQQQLYVKVAGIYCSVGSIKKAGLIAWQLPDKSDSEEIYWHMAKKFLEKGKIQWAINIAWALRYTEIIVRVCQDIARFFYDTKQTDMAMEYCWYVWEIYKSQDYLVKELGKYDLWKIARKFEKEAHLKAFYYTIDFDEEDPLQFPAWFALMHIDPVRRMECIARIYRTYKEDWLIEWLYDDLAPEDFVSLFRLVHTKMPASLGKTAMIAEGLRRLYKQPDKIVEVIPAAMSACLMNQKLLENALFLYAVDLYTLDGGATPLDHQHLQQLSSLISRAAVFAPAARPYAFHNLQEWITSVKDEDAHTQITLWAKSVYKGNMSVQEFEINTLKLLENT